MWLVNILAPTPQQCNNFYGQVQENRIRGKIGYILLKPLEGQLQARDQERL
jgi:hypothetical protein